MRVDHVALYGIAFIEVFLKPLGDPLVGGMKMAFEDIILPSGLYGVISGDMGTSPIPPEAAGRRGPPLRQRAAFSTHSCRRRS